MQTRSSGSNLSSGSIRGGQGDGFLEDSDRVTLNNGDKHVATLVSRLSVSEWGSDELACTAYHFEHLFWTDFAAILSLQGATTSQLLGPGMVLVKGKARPVYDPQPGFNDVVVLQIIDNPGGLDALSITKKWIDVEGA